MREFLFVNELSATDAWEKSFAGQRTWSNSYQVELNQIDHVLVPASLPQSDYSVGARNTAASKSDLLHVLFSA